MSEWISNRRGFTELLGAFRTEGFRRNYSHFRLKAFSKQTLLWDYVSTGKLDVEKPDSIIDILNMCGATKLVTSFSGKMGQKQIDASDWKEWFLSRAMSCTLIPDTNFIFNHYCSGLLSRVLGDNFKKLKFRIPRLVVLEIERQGNKKTGMEKRLAFYALVRLFT